MRRSQTIQRNPRSATGIGETAVPLAMILDGPATDVLAEFRTRASFDPKVTIRLQASTTLQAWSNLAFRTGDGPWIGRTPTITNLAGGRQLCRFTPPALQNSSFAFTRARAPDSPHAPPNPPTHLDHHPPRHGSHSVRRAKPPLQTPISALRHPARMREEQPAAQGGNPAHILQLSGHRLRGRQSA